MNTKLVNTAAEVILAALTQNRTAAGIATALDAAGLLKTPERPPATVYRAEHDAIVMGLYTTREAAREHCMTVARRDSKGAALEWIPDEPSEDDSPEELRNLGFGPDDEWFGTGYVVTPLEVASQYDEEADE